jgi:hypothetical protein
MPESEAEAQALLEMGTVIRGSAQALAERPPVHHEPVVEGGMVLAEVSIPLCHSLLPYRPPTNSTAVVC